jgi:hypothetical protein
MKLSILHLTLLSLIIYQTTFFVSAVDPTIGFTCNPLEELDYVIEKPYDVSQKDNYYFANGVHTFWIEPREKTYRRGNTKYRSEIHVIVSVYLVRR